MTRTPPEVVSFREVPFVFRETGSQLIRLGDRGIGCRDGIPAVDHGGAKLPPCRRKAGVERNRATEQRNGLVEVMLHVERARAFRVSLQRVERAGRHLFEWRSICHALQRLAHLAAKLARHLIDAVHEPTRPIDSGLVRREHGAGIRADESQRNHEPVAEAGDIAGDDCLHAFASRELAGRRKVEPRSRRQLHALQRSGHARLVEQGDRRRLGEVGAHTLGHDPRDAGVRATDAEVRDDHEVALAQPSGGEERASRPNAERAHHHERDDEEHEAAERIDSAPRCPLP